MAKDKSKGGKKKPTANLPDRGKAPRSALHLEDRRTPRAVDPANARTLSPVWAFRVVDLDGPWGWSRIDGPALATVLTRLKLYESMVWGQIDGPTGSHSVEIERLCKAAQDRLMDIQQDDASSLYSLRIAGKPRVWGILDGHVLRILWWDPEHEVCPSPKKHT